MANSLKGEVEVTVAPLEKGGEASTLTLVYDWDALVTLEDALDMGIIEILALMNRGLRLKLVRALFWAGLRARHPGIGLGEAAELIPRCGGIIQLYGVIAEGIRRAFPTPSTEAAEGDADPQTEAAGTP